MKKLSIRKCASWSNMSIRSSRDTSSVTESRVAAALDWAARASRNRRMVMSSISSYEITPSMKPHSVALCNQSASINNLMLTARRASVKTRSLPANYFARSGDEDFVAVIESQESAEWNFFEHFQLKIVECCCNWADLLGRDRHRKFSWNTFWKKVETIDRRVITMATP